jgi:hypothetical protein
MLNRQQFHQEEAFPETRPTAAPITMGSKPQPPSFPQGRSAYTGKQPPVGMRGSASDRMGLPGRLAKQQAGRQRWESLRSRIEDSNDVYEADEETGDEDYEAPDMHPLTGLPERGEISTHNVLGMGRSAAPSWATYGGSAVSARRKGSTVKEIPLYQGGRLRAIGTPQSEVSSTRLHEALIEPETQHSPRLPYKELPYVYQQDGGTTSEHNTVIDGNHRTGAHILGGQMFMQARVITDESEDVVKRQTMKVNLAKSRAKQTAAEFDRGEAIEERQNRLYYGTDF